MIFPLSCAYLWILVDICDNFNDDDIILLLYFHKFISYFIPYFTVVHHLDTLEKENKTILDEKVSLLYFTWLYSRIVWLTPFNVTGHVPCGPWINKSGGGDQWLLLITITCPWYVVGYRIIVLIFFKYPDVWIKDFEEIIRIANVFSICGYQVHVISGTCIRKENYVREHWLEVPLSKRINDGVWVICFVLFEKLKGHDRKEKQVVGMLISIHFK